MLYSFYCFYCCCDQNSWHKYLKGRKIYCSLSQDDRRAHCWTLSSFPRLLFSHWHPACGILPPTLRTAFSSQETPTQTQPNCNSLISYRQALTMSARQFLKFNQIGSPNHPSHFPTNPKIKKAPLLWNYEIHLYRLCHWEAVSSRRCSPLGLVEQSYDPSYSRVWDKRIASSRPALPVE